MRSARFTLGLALLLAPSVLWPGSRALPGGMPDGAPTAQRVARLIQQLGHSDFARREAAARELEKIGVPALDALRQAHAMTDDAEVRVRAKQTIDAISRPLPAAAAKKELAQRQGERLGDGGKKLAVKGNRSGMPAPPPPPPQVDLHSERFSTDLNLLESKTPIHRVSLTCQVADGGGGRLTLDPNGPKLDEFGQAIAEGKRLPEVTLNVTLKLVKKEAGLGRYEVRGPKIASRMYFVAGAGVNRLLVHGKDGKVRYLVDLHEPRPFPPCHPGCFPAGTPVQVPGGTKAIDRIREGNLVIMLDADGKPSPVKVTGVFKTRNRVLTLRTTDGELITTDTQPIAKEKGGFTPAGELKRGERIWRWTDGKRQATRVLDVSAAERETDVFNLILGETTPFIAGGFVVRSKPPAALLPLP